MEEIGNLNIQDAGNLMENMQTVEEAALSNPIVLEILFQYAKVQELKNCRLVCKMWRKEATSVLKKKAMIYFDGHYDEDEMTEEEDLEKDNHRDVINYMRTMSQFRCESYCLSRGAKHTECSRKLTEFFGVCGSEIKHLRIDYEFHSHFKVSLFRYILTTYMPNLEHLDIRNIPVVEGRMTRHQELLNVSNDVVGHGQSDGLPVFWSQQPYIQFPAIKRIDLWNYNAYVANLGRNFVRDLFEIAPNLECIQVVDRFYSNIITYVVEEIRDNPTRNPNIKELLFDSYQSPTPGDIKVLSELNLKLKVLHLGALPELIDVTHFQTLLNKQSATLEKLQFGNSIGNNTIRVSLPIFPKLKRLELTQDVAQAGQFNVIFDPVNYGNQFPVLKILLNCRSRVFFEHDEMVSKICQRSKYEGKHFFRGMTGLWQSLFPAGDQVCSSLRILDIPYPKDPQSPFVRRLAKLFPLVNNPNLNAARSGN